jgi:hypothetical protein
MWQPSACPPISRRQADGIRFAQVNSCGLAESTPSGKTRQISDRSLEHPPGRSSRSPRSVASITAMNGAQRKRPACPPCTSARSAVSHLVIAAAPSGKQRRVRHKTSRCERYRLSGWRQSQQGDSATVPPLCFGERQDADPDQLSFVHAVRVIRRRLPHAVAIPPSGPAGLP